MSSVRIGATSVAELIPADTERPHIENGATVYGDAYIGNGSFVGAGAVILAKAEICPNSVIGENVVIGAEVRTGYDLLVLDGARICPNDTVIHSSDARTFGAEVTIGEGVWLHDEAELGNGAIVPTEETIAYIEGLGAKERVMTVYGAADGYRLSLGCQIGITFERLQELIQENESDSAKSYLPRMPEIEERGRAVQHMYEANFDIASSLLNMRSRLGLSIPRLSHHFVH